MWITLWKAKMKDAEWKVEKEKVKRLFDYWIHILGLKWYEIDLVWKAGDLKTDEDGYLASMNVTSLWEYRTATINIWLEEIPQDMDKLERMVVHELVHILVQPTRSEDGFDVEKEEYTVESLARAFIWVRDSQVTKVTVEDL